MKKEDQIVFFISYALVMILVFMIAIFLFGCNPEYPPSPVCTGNGEERLFHYNLRVDIQHEVLLQEMANGGSYESLEEETVEALEWIKAKLESEDSAFQLDYTYHIWFTPDTFATDQRLQELGWPQGPGWRHYYNDLITGVSNANWDTCYNKSYAHLVLGQQAGKSAWVGCPGGSSYCVYTLESDGWSWQWKRFYWQHEMYHMMGASHPCSSPQVDTCNVMITGGNCGQENCPGILYDAPLLHYSKMEIANAMIKYCTGDPAFMPPPAYIEEEEESIIVRK